MTRWFLSTMKSVTRLPGLNSPTWQSPKSAVRSHFTPGTFAFTWATVEPTPMPFAVRSFGEVVSTEVTASLPWKTIVTSG